MAGLKKIGVILLRISVSLALLIFLFRQIDAGSLLEIIRKADKPLLYFCFLLAFFGYFFCFLRWKMLLETAGIDLPGKRLISAFSGGIFFNTFLPSSIGGDFIRSADAAYHSKKTGTVVATVLLDRLSGFTGMIAVALIALVCGFGVINDRRLVLAIGLLTALLLSIILIVFHPRISGFLVKLLSSGRPGRFRISLRNVLEEMRGFKEHRAVIFKNLLISMLIQAMGPLSTYIVAVSFRLEVNIVYFFIFVPIISAVTLLPVSIGGLGVRDYMTVLLFTRMGIPRDFAFAFSLLGFFFILVYAAIGGLIYVLTLHHRRV